MKEIQQLRRIAVRLGVSGTVMPIAETRLYKGGYGFVVLQCYVPTTQNRSPSTSPLCTVFRTTVDKFGNRKQFNKDIYNMLYTEDKVIENAKYMLFETPLPKAFTDTAGELEMVFTYSEIDDDNKVVTRLSSGIYRTSIADSDVSDGETVDPVGGELARLNDITVRFEQLEDSVDALLQPPDCVDANQVGTPNVSLTEDGRLKFDELKGEKGDTGEISVGAVKQVGYNEPLKIENSGTASDAVLDFEIPQGKPAFIKMGKVITLPPDSDANVVNVGTENDPIFDFYIPEGKGFLIDKTYSSVADMNASYATDGVRLYGFVIIDSGDVEDEDNAKLFIKTETEYKYLTDLSEAQGIKGEQGTGISAITADGKDVNDGNVYKITLSDGNTYNFTAPKGERGFVALECGGKIVRNHPPNGTEKLSLHIANCNRRPIVDDIVTILYEDTENNDSYAVTLKVTGNVSQSVFYECEQLSSIKTTGHTGNAGAGISNVEIITNAEKVLTSNMIEQVVKYVEGKYEDYSYEAFETLCELNLGDSAFFNISSESSCYFDLIYEVEGETGGLGIVQDVQYFQGSIGVIECPALDSNNQDRQIEALHIMGIKPPESDSILSTQFVCTHRFDYDNFPKIIIKIKSHLRVEGVNGTYITGTVIRSKIEA